MSEYCKKSEENEDACDDGDKEWPTCILSEIESKLYNIQVNVMLKYSPLDTPHEEFIERAKKYATADREYIYD